MALIAGTSLGRYEIQTQLGAGGMGEVYLARDPMLGRTVAVKLLPTIFASDPDRLRRFEQEARTSAALNHPRILAIHDVGRAGDQPFIVMEYVRGETLGAYMKRGRLPLARALEIGAEIANALAAAHGARIVHRDLKPANIMITGDGHVKVLDFGLAKFLWTDTSASTLHGSAPEQTVSGQVLGTPGYMSPEQLLGDRVDERTDIFTLGVILFELVTGQRPYGDVFDLLSSTGSGTPIRTAREVDVAVAPDVSEVIARAMAKRPADRFQTAGELEAALQHLLQDGPAASTKAPRSGTSIPAAPGVGRRRLFWYSAWLLAGSISIGIAIKPLVERMGASDTAVPAERPVIVVLPLDNLTGDESKGHIGLGISDTLLTTLARLSSISVATRGDMMEAGVATLPIVEIGRSLGATMLVRGSIQQEGNLLRANIRLETLDAKVVWSGFAEAPQDQLFSIQEELADLLLAALRIRLTPAERRDLARPPTEDTEALKQYWQGLELLDSPDNADFAAAVAHLVKATERDPEFSLAHAALGEAYRRRAVRTNDAELMGRAEEAVTRALRLDSAPEVRLSLARVYRSTGKPTLAEDEVRRVLVEQPENDDAHRLLGELLAKAGQPKAALAALRKAADIRPKYWLNQEVLGLFFYGNGQLDDAIGAFTRLTELKPRDALPFQQLGSMYLLKGDFARASEKYEKSNELLPNAESFAGLGTIAYYQDRYEEAFRHYQQAATMQPTIAAHRGNLGDAYLKRGQRAEALAAYREAIKLGEQALKINPNDVTTTSRLGVYYAKVGERKEAERHADIAFRTNPTDPDVLYLRAVTLALIGRRNDAMQQLSDAIKRGYAVHLARDDDDLASLRDLPAFQRVTTAAKSR